MKPGNLGSELLTSEHFCDNWYGIVDRFQIPENDPFRAAGPRKTTYFRVHPKSGASPNLLPSRTDPKCSTKILNKYGKNPITRDMLIPDVFSCLLPIFRFRRFHPKLYEGGYLRSILRGGGFINSKVRAYHIVSLFDNLLIWG